MESGASAVTLSQNSELHFLRSRVRELEREKAELSAENHRLQTMLVNGESRSTSLSPVLHIRGLSQSDRKFTDFLSCLI